MRSLRGQKPSLRALHFLLSLLHQAAFKVHVFTNSLFRKSRLYLSCTSKFFQLLPNRLIPKPLPQCEALGTAALGFPGPKSVGVS